MSAQGIHIVTELFEQELCRYTGSPFTVAVDNCSNALFLCLMGEKVRGMSIQIPCRTYPAVACEIIYAGAKIEFLPVEGTTLTGAYQLKPTRIFDSALRFTADMYLPGML